MDLFVLTDLIGCVGAMTEMYRDKTSLIGKTDFNRSGGRDGGGGGLLETELLLYFYSVLKAHCERFSSI